MYRCAALCLCLATWPAAAEQLVLAAPPGVIVIEAGTESAISVPEPVREVAISRSGRRLAVVTEAGALLLLDRDRPFRRRHLAEGLVVADPAWSPTGESIAVSSAGDLWLVDVASGVPRRLTFSGLPERREQPAWSPSGPLLAFTVRNGASGRIHYVKPDGTAERFVTEGFSPDFSPDGQRLVFVGSLRRSLWRMGVDGSDLQMIASFPSFAGLPAVLSPRWSLDAERVVFQYRGGVCSRRVTRPGLTRLFSRPVDFDIGPSVEPVIAVPTLGFAGLVFLVVAVAAAAIWQLSRRSENEI